MSITAKEKQNMAANYRKLWLLERTNAPFMVRATKIQKDWNLPINVEGSSHWNTYKHYSESLIRADLEYLESDEYKKIIEIKKLIYDIKFDKQVEESIDIKLLSRAPSQRFKRDIESLYKYGFEPFWLEALAIYVITDKIIPPYKERSKECPPEHIVEDWRIFNLKVKKGAQHKFLKEQGYSAKQIASMEKLKVNSGTKMRVLHSDLEIAQEVWGDWEDLTRDRKMINLVKKRHERFSKVFVDLTDEDMKILQSLHF